MKAHKIKRGLNVPLSGKPEPKVETTTSPDVLGVSPREYHGIKGKLDVNEGDRVKLGQTLYHDKRDERVRFASPAAGRITEIVYGPRRSIDKIIISPEGEDAVSFPATGKASISTLDRQELIDRLLEGGLWPYIRQRPYDRIAVAEHQPSSIFINAMDTAPAVADPEFALQEFMDDYYAGVEAIKRLANGKPVHVVVPGGKSDSPFHRVEGIEKHSFAGKHPAGLVGTHIHHIDPVAKPGKVVWHLNARDVALIGSFLINGRYPVERVIAVAGPGVKKPHYIRTRSGVRLGQLLRDNLKEGEQRIISGNALTGLQMGEDGFLGNYDSTVTVIPEGGKRRFLGWLMPGFKRHSYTNAFASSFLPVSEYHMDTSLHGEERAFVMTGNYRSVMGIDLYPDFLAKSIIIEDIEAMERLGILEMSPEDVALCSYICPSKIEFTDLYRKGLDLFETEMA